MGWHPGRSTSGHLVFRAATPQPSWQASLRGLQADNLHSVVKVWACKRFAVVLLCFWALLMLCYYVNAGFSNSVSPTEYIQWSNENANGQHQEKTSAWGALIRYFFPTTCIPRENQVVKPCYQLQDLNRSECLGYKCCYSSFKISHFSCFTPIKDKPAQMFRVLGLGVIIVIILACLPTYCCTLCRRSRWANTLRRKVNRFLKAKKKQRKRVKRNTEMLETAVDEAVLDDEKEQETRALFSH
ncbi:FMR1 neighbor protein [Hippopotamus amphibius kiboko]|uniref:FMR1 neighbor protein n=1 Tax=Hippopotamus amphibius kiboko TaxID=575201 RepID=UPI002597319F|nr:FMR1 neighbor protein [Hippopotamus amphibius kiboko]